MSEVPPTNAISPTFVTLVSPVQPAKLPLPSPDLFNEERLFGNLTSVRAIQPENASLFIVVTLSGITNSDRYLHPINARVPIRINPSGRIALVRPVSFLKALSAISEISIPLKSRTPLPVADFKIEPSTVIS